MRDYRLVKVLVNYSGIIKCKESDERDVVLSHSEFITKIVILRGKIILWQKK